LYTLTFFSLGFYNISTSDVQFRYLNDWPLIDASTAPQLEGNVNGPSLIKAPGWIENRLGKYYLYFAYHEGELARHVAALQKYPTATPTRY